MNKRIFLFILAMTFAGLFPRDAQAQSYSRYPHFPDSHTHGTSICWGYATAKAFGMADNTGACTAQDANRGGISSTFFMEYSGYGNVEDEDIMGFGNGSPPPHVAFVTSAGSQTPATIQLRFIENEDNSEIKTASLELVLTGSENQYGQDILKRSGPIKVFKNEQLWEITVRNKINGQYNLGQIEFRGSQRGSPYLSDKEDWNNSFTINTLEDGETHGGYEQAFDKWLY